MMFEKRCLYLRAGIQDAITRIVTNPDTPSKASIRFASILQAVLDEDEASTPISLPLVQFTAWDNVTGDFIANTFAESLREATEKLTLGHEVELFIDENDHRKKYLRNIEREVERLEWCSTKEDTYDLAEARKERDAVKSEAPRYPRMLANFPVVGGQWVIAQTEEKNCTRCAERNKYSWVCDGCLQAFGLFS